MVQQSEWEEDLYHSLFNFELSSFSKISKGKSLGIVQGINPQIFVGLIDTKLMFGQEAVMLKWEMWALIIQWEYYL